MNKHSSIFHTFCMGILAATGMSVLPLHASILFQDDFSGGLQNSVLPGTPNGISNFVLVDNVRSTPANPSTAVKNAGTVSIETSTVNNVNVGLYSTGGVDLTAVPGFEMTFDVASVSFPESNGVFLGITDNTSFFRTSLNFGFHITASGGLDLVANEGSGGGTQTFSILTGLVAGDLSTPFSLSFELNADDSYSWNLTGLPGITSGSGNLTPGSYTTLFDGSDHIVMSQQDSPDGPTNVLVVDSVTLTAIPEPSSVALLACAFVAIAIYRRR